MVGSAEHLVTLGIPMIIRKLREHELPWPTLTSNDEMCANCKQSPGSKGCKRVRTTYKATLPTGENEDLTVDHTNVIDDGFSKYKDASYK